MPPNLTDDKSTLVQVPNGTKPLPEPMLTQDLCRQMASLGLNELIVVIFLYIRGNKIRRILLKQAPLWLCHGYVSALTTRRVYNGVTTLRTSDLHNAQATFLNP